MLKDKVQNIKKELQNQEIDAVLVADVANITYLTDYANFSENEREAYLLITKDEQYLITDGRYSEAVKKQVPHFQLFERSHLHPIEELFKSLKEIQTLGIEEDVITVSEHKLLKKHFKKTKHVSIKKHRAVKTAEETTKIEKAAALGDQAFKFILKKIKVAISEKELASKLELFIKKNGADLSFPAIVAFGENSAIPHHQTGNIILGPGSSSGQKGQFVLFDFGVKLENYCSDMTRTVFFGKPSEKQKKIYETVLAAQQKAVDFINTRLKSGKKLLAAEVDKVAREYIVSQGYPTIPHSLGHGIGLEVHEHPNLSPKSKDILKEGMVFSIEPGIYFPKENSPTVYLESFGGVRIEDLYALGKNKLRRLTDSPKKLLVV